MADWRRCKKLVAAKVGMDNIANTEDKKSSDDTGGSDKFQKVR